MSSKKKSPKKAPTKDEILAAERAALRKRIDDLQSTVAALRGHIVRRSDAYATLYQEKKELLYTQTVLYRALSLTQEELEKHKKRTVGFNEALVAKYSPAPAV